MIEAKIELLDENGDPAGDPIATLTGSAVRVLPVDFRLYPVDDIRDADSDRCMTAYIDWIAVTPPVVNAINYPRVVITGVATDVRVSDTVETDDDGNNRYTPRRHPAWPKGHIGMVRITLNTTGAQS